MFNFKISIIECNHIHLLLLIIIETLDDYFLFHIT